MALIVTAVCRMKGFARLSGALALSCFAIEAAARAVGHSPNDWVIPYKREALQDIVRFEVEEVHFQISD